MRVEFTVEPFVAGQPGPHVTEAIAAVEERGISVDVGPFGSGFDAEETDAIAAIHALLLAAHINGATRVSVQTTASEHRSGDHDD
jgi:uncharacterized protein YqgV (UPF0045/DUF77 family)